MTSSIGLNGISLHDFAHRVSRSGTRHALIACDTADAQLQGLPTGPASEAILALLTDSLRSTDAATRASDGVFLILLDRVRDLPDAVSVAQRVSRAFRHPDAGDTAGHLCCGVTLVEFGESETSLVTRATGALHLAQHAGAGRIVSSPPL